MDQDSVLLLRGVYSASAPMSSSSSMAFLELIVRWDFASHSCVCGNLPWYGPPQMAGVGEHTTAISVLSVLVCPAVSMGGFRES
jgi:hypothetical protein